MDERTIKTENRNRNQEKIVRLGFSSSRILLQKKSDWKNCVENEYLMGLAIFIAIYSDPNKSTPGHNRIRDNDHNFSLFVS